MSFNDPTDRVWTRTDALFRNISSIAAFGELAKPELKRENVGRRRHLRVIEERESMQSRLK